MQEKLYKTADAELYQTADSRCYQNPASAV